MKHWHWRNRVWALAWMIMAVALWIGVAEWYLYNRGYRVEKEGQLYNVPTEFDPYLGWRYPPCSERHFQTLNGKVVAHLGADAARVSRPQLAKKAAAKVLVLGCSHTFGFGVSDQETFCWKLNEMYPEVCFDNFAVPGYGTCQCYLREKQILLSQPDYDVVLYCCFADHVRRNTMWQPVVGYLLVPGKPYAFAPRVDLDTTGQLCFYDPVRRWPWDDRLISVNFAKRIYYCWQHQQSEELNAQCGSDLWMELNKREGSRFAERWSEANQRNWAAFWALVGRMNQEAQAHGAKFGLVWLFGFDSWNEACRQRWQLALDYPWGKTIVPGRQK